MDRRPRILWLHPQPEHYFNCMMDDLSRQGTCEYMAAFASAGVGSYTETPLPRVAKSIFLRLRKGSRHQSGSMFERVHENWREDLYPLEFDVAIVAGYAGRTQRELIRDCSRRGIPVAIWADSNLRAERGNSLKARIKRAIKRRVLPRLVKNTDYVMVANRLGKAYWRYYGAPSSKIRVCPYYADYVRVEAGRRMDRKEVLKAIGLSEDVRYVFSAARLVPAKGLDLLLKAFKESGLAEKNVHCVITGTGPLEATLKLQAGDLLGRRIHLLGFKQPSENLALMAHADLFILASLYEPHGIVIQEATAAGTPVLASDVCGAAYDLVKPGISGQLFRTGDADDLRRKLVRLMEDPAVLPRMRAGARETFERWFEETSPIRIVDALSRSMAAKAKRTGERA